MSAKTKGSHHRVYNTLNSVSLLLNRLKRNVSGSQIEQEIGALVEHMRSYTIIHRMLEECVDDGDQVNLPTALRLWCAERDPAMEFICEDSMRVSATFASNILQLLAEICASRDKSPDSRHGVVTLRVNPLELEVHAPMLRDFSRGPSHALYSALVSAVCEGEPRVENSSAEAAGIFSAKLKMPSASS